MRRLVRHGQRRALPCIGEVERGERLRRLGVAFREGRLEKKIDGEPAAGTGSSLVEFLPVHAIDPSIHDLMQGGPSERRRFLDWGVFHVEHSYLDAWRRYRRVLGSTECRAQERAADRLSLRPWTAALAEAGELVDQQRAGYIAHLQPELAERGAAILGRPLAIVYHRGWPADSPFAAALRAGESRDRVLGNTELGPHRADLEILQDAEAVHGQASRGQQKLAAASLILAQVSVFGRIRGRSVLLVDDPAAELDGSALERLLTALDTVRAQLILTGLSTSQLAPRPGSAVFHVERGEVRGL